MKPLVIYHASCADGFGAAFAAWSKLGDDAEYVPMQYGKDYSLPENTFAIDDREIYILDFSFPRGVMDLIFARAKRVVWLDHHKTAFEMWEVKEGQRVWAETEGRHVKLHMDKSGAMLAWEYFHPGTKVPMFIQHIDDYDRWQFNLRGSKAFQKALWSYAPWSFEQWAELTHDNLYAQLFTEGTAILRAHEQNVAAVVKNAAIECRIDVSDEDDCDYLYGLAANCPPHLQSDVGHELANQSGTFGLLWSIDKDKQCRCSLRSNGDYDVSAIAKAFGGGGHRNAAGFTTDIQNLLEWIK